MWAILFVLALGASIGGQTLDRGRAEGLAQRASDRLLTLQREAERLASEEKTLLTELRSLEVQRQLKTEELRQLDASSAEVETDLAAATARMDSLQKQERAARPQLRAQLLATYKLGRAQYLRLLLSTSDVRRIGEASRTVASLAQLNRDRVASHQRTLKELASARSVLEARSRELEALRAQALVARAAADRAARAHATLVSDIDRRRDLNAQLSGELLAAQRKLQVTLRDIAGENDAPSAVAALPLKPFRGDLDWPATGSARRRFSAATLGRPSAVRGIDIAAPEGSPALAIHEGVVAFADPFAGFGNLVIVDHGSQTFSLYAYLLEIAVKKGAHVERGESIGSIGTAPAGTSGLYFEMRVDGEPVDPLQWLRKR